MEPVSALKTGAAAISLATALAKLIKESRTETAVPSSLTELLARLQVEAYRLSRDLEIRLRLLVEQSVQYGLDPKKSLNQQLGDLGWYNVLTRSRLKSLREECNAAYRQLTSFMDDATALLLCSQRQEMASSAFLASLATKRALDALFINEDLPIGKLLDGMLAAASQVSAELQAA